MRILGDFANSQILDAAIEYDFFTLIDKGFQTSEEIAREAATVLRALQFCAGFRNLLAFLTN